MRKRPTSPLAFNAASRLRASRQQNGGLPNGGRGWEAVVTHTCSDTIEETSSDDTVARRKRTRFHRDIVPGHFCSYTLVTCFMPTFMARTAGASACCGTDRIQNFIRSTCRNLRFMFRLAHVVRWTISTELIALDDTLEEPPHGGYAGVRLGEAQNSGPAAHERDVAEEPCARRTHQRGRRRSTRKPRLHHARSSKFAVDRYSSSAAQPHSQSSTADAQQLPETH